MIGYTEIIKGKLLKYNEETLLRWETWETNGYIFKCYWCTHPRNDFVKLPMTIKYKKI